MYILHVSNLYISVALFRLSKHDPICVNKETDMIKI